MFENRIGWCGWFGLLTWCWGCWGPAHAAERPNVVVILADDQGWGDLSLHGNTNLQTPRIDSLARDGARFERFYACPLCAPTRAEFLTGRYHSRGGVHGVTTGAERLNLDEKTIADAFRAAGYVTGAFGKWHNGSQYPYHPRGRGFDEYYGFTSGHWGHYFDPVLEHNGALVRGKGYIVDDLTDHALAFIETHKDRPFFCYVPYNTPHSPFQVPDRFWEKFKDHPIPLRATNPKLEDLPSTRCALAMCENLDWNVGRILDKLDELKLAEKTIVVYFSDNGPNTWRWNGDMKGRKGQTDEGGVRVPCLVRWPGRIRPGTVVRPIAAAIDLFPTLASLAGVSAASPQPLDGVDLAPLLLGSARSWPDRMIFSHNAGQVSVRTDQFRLDHRGQLFDMNADPGQQRDISAEKPEIAVRLAQAVSRWKQEVLREGKDDRPFPVGYREFPTTPLPARDGVASGGIRRSAPAPNCSYFTDWRSTNDAITWDIDVNTAGRYEAVLYYTCPPEDVGATIELSFQNATARAKVAEPFHPPLFDSMDRVPRKAESYVKEFRPLRLGSLHLAKGRGPLTLRALSIPGKQVMDLWAVVLTLVAPAETSTGWKAGAASVVITPEEPMWMAGYASRNKPSEGKFQDLFAKALALEDAAGTRVVIVTLDLIGVPRPLREAVEKQVAQKFGLPPENLLLNASHTHSGPVIRVGKTFYELSPEQQQRTNRFAVELQEKLVALVGRAIAELAPARLGYSHARAGFAMNRRLPTPKGYQNSPYPDGPVDHDVPVLRVDGPDGKLRAVLFGYACHNTTLGLYQFCGDYAGYAQQFLEQSHPGAVALFMAGCGADQNPYPRGTLELAQQHGRTLATAVEAALLPQPRPINGPLRAALAEAKLPFAAVPGRDELLQAQQKSTNPYEKRHAARLLEELEKTGRLPESYSYPIQVFRFGDDLILVALAGEVVVDYSLRLKRELAGPAVWVAGYSNDVFGYVPSARVLKEGGYEASGAVFYSSLPSAFAPSIEDSIVGKVHELVRATKP